MSVFQYTRGPRDAKILVVAESWGVQEERAKQPLVGESGRELDLCLASAGLGNEKILYTNVVSERPAANEMKRFFYTNAEVKAQSNPVNVKGLYPKPNVIEGLRQLNDLIDHIKPEIIIGLGNYALWALTENSFSIKNETGVKVPIGIMNWRGSQLYIRDNIKFVPTYHPAASLRNQAWRFQIIHDLRARVANRNWKVPEYNFIIRPSFERVMRTFDMLLESLDEIRVELSVDIETRVSMIACIGIAWTVTDAICVPILTTEEPYSYWRPEEEVEIYIKLRKILQHPNADIIGQNLLYDAQYFYRFYNFKLKIAFDTLIAQHLCYPGTELNLGYLSSMYCSFHRYWKDDGKEWNVSMNEEQLWSYNCMDCCRTKEVAHGIMEVIDYYKFHDKHQETLDQLHEALNMMFRGVRIDKKVKDSMSFELLDVNAMYADKLENMLPEDVYARDPKKSPWYTSSQQLSTVFQQVLGYKPFFNRSARRYTMDDAALEHYSKENPILGYLCDTLREFNSLSTFKTFTEMKLDEDGRMRCEFSPTAETYRWKSRKNVFGTGGNLQNLPTGDEELHLPNIRKQFIPDRGYIIIDADLSGADAQVVAWDANDEDLKNAFRAGLKIHLKNARDMFPHETKDMDDDELKDISLNKVIGVGSASSKFYTVMKSGVHGTNYYGTARGMAPRLGLPLTKMQEFQERWFYLHPDIRSWHQTTRMKLEGIVCWNCGVMAESPPACSECGAQLGRTIKNAWGYRRIYFDRIDDKILREALAWVGQSSVAINTRKGLLLLPKVYSYLQNLLQVHDSLVFQIPSNRKHELEDIRGTLNTITTPYADPLTIPWGLKFSDLSWGDCK